MRKIAALFSLYHPDLIQLKNNVQAIANHVDTVILWRNSNEDIETLKNISGNIVFMGNGENQFLAFPMNECLKWCHKNGYDYLLTMDQDSLWNNFENFLNIVHTSNRQDIAIFAPNVNWKYPKSDKMIETTYVISSGSLIKVNAALEVGGFNEKYKIYWLDGILCHKICKAGYHIMIVPECNIDHKFGNITKTLFGFETPNYSPEVYYYLIRNMIWSHRQYGVSTVSYKCIGYNLLYNVRGIILGDKNKIKKLSMVMKALIHGLFLPYE